MLACYSLMLAALLSPDALASHAVDLLAVGRKLSQPMSTDVQSVHPCRYNIMVAVVLSVSCCIMLAALPGAKSHRIQLMSQAYIQMKLPLSCRSLSL